MANLGTVTGNNNNSFKFYTGVVNFKVLACNPTESEYKKITGKDMPFALNTVGERDGVKTITLNFLLYNENDFGYPNYMWHRISLTNTLVEGKESGKYQVADDFGRTAWVKPEEFASKAVLLEKKDGGTYQANIDKNYHRIRRNEDILVNFLRTLLNKANVQKWNPETKRFEGYIDDTTKALFALENIEDYFKGDVSELNEVIKVANSLNKEIGVLVGVRQYINQNGEFKTQQVTFANGYASSTEVNNTNKPEERKYYEIRNALMQFNTSPKASEFTYEAITGLKEVNTKIPQNSVYDVETGTATPMASQDTSEELPF